MINSQFLEFTDDLLILQYKTREDFKGNIKILKILFSVLIFF